MLVGRWMAKRLVTVRPESSVDEARSLLRQNHIRHLPVTDGRRLLGIVTEQDLRVAEALLRRPGPAVVADVMTESVITVAPETTIEQAAMLMADNKIGGLPVVDAEDALVGMITKSDVLNVFLQSLGVGSGSARLEVLLPDRPGALAPAARVLGELGVNIVSVLSAGGEGDRKLVVFRIAADELEPVLTELAAAGVEVVSVEEGVL
jgi:acetoin utilization protein AcuB